MLKAAKLASRLPTRVIYKPKILPTLSPQLYCTSKNTFSSSKSRHQFVLSLFKKALILTGTTAFVCFSISDHVSCALDSDDSKKTSESSTSSPNIPTQSNDKSGLVRFSANVLILGDSQSGKSTFIQKLHSMAGLEIPESLKVGTGGEATTDRTIIYHVPIQIRELALTKGVGRSEVNWEQALTDYDTFDELADSRDAKLEERKLIAEVKLNLIDTPGLKGTDKNDETNMFDLLQTLAKVGSVNCVLLFNKGSNYGPNFEETLFYYQDMLGSTVPVHMVHTKYTTDDMLKDIASNVNTYKESPRIREFKKLFPNISGEHWIIDSLPKKGRPFRELLTITTVYNWLASLATERSIDTRNLSFNKTQKMRAIDKSTQSRNQALSEGYGLALANKDSELRKILPRIVALSRTIDEQKQELERQTAKLDEKNSKNSEFMKTKNISHTWTIWPIRQQHEVKIQAKHPIMEVEKVIFNKPYSDWVPDSESQYGEDVRSSEYYIRIASSIWSGCYGSISLYTYKKYKYAELIPYIQDKVKFLDTEYWKNLKELHVYETEHKEFKESIEELQGKIEAYNLTNPKLASQKIPFAFYEAAEKIYKSDRWNSDSATDLNALANELTEAYYQYFFASKEQASS